MNELAPGDRVIFILLRAMGDVLLATPAIRAFKQAFPDAILDVLVERVPAQPLRNNPAINQIVIAPNRGSPLKSYLPLVRELRRNRYTLAIDFQSTPGSALLTRLTGARERIGFDRRMRSWAYTQPVQPDGSPGYATLPKFKLLEGLGIATPAQSNVDALLPKIFPDGKATAQADAFLSNKGLAEAESILGLAPYCRRDWRMWPIEKWRALIADYSRRAKTTWLLFAGPDERESLKSLESIEGVRVIWVGMNDLLDAGALMQRCKAVVTGENGLLHVAVAAGVPTFSIFCGRDAPAQWVPGGTTKHVALDLRASEPAQKADVAWELETFLVKLL